MFRLLSRWMFKAPPSNPLRSIFCVPAIRPVHSTEAPYSGPPSYNIIARRFSSPVNPQSFFTSKIQQEARDRGGFIDIHDLGGVDPEDYDVLITDINNKKLDTEISKVVGIQYLAKATKADVNNVVEIGHGYVYGQKLRTLFPCVVNHDGKANWIIFVVDTAAPLTYVSAGEVLGINKDHATTIKIAGYHHPVYVSPTNSHFPELNILGADFLNAYNISPWYDYGRSKVTLYFGKGWKVTRGPVL